MIFRQGDILLKKTSKKVDTAPTNTNNECVVGHGEVTGHIHVVKNAQWLVDACEDINRFAETGESKGEIFIEVMPSGGKIVHDEHNTIELPQGVYQVIRQREYDPELHDIRPVLD